jgi:hypothetical protein
VCCITKANSLGFTSYSLYFLPTPAYSLYYGQSCKLLPMLWGTRLYMDMAYVRTYIPAKSLKSLFLVWIIFSAKPFYLQLSDTLGATRGEFILLLLLQLPVCQRSQKTFETNCSKMTQSLHSCFSTLPVSYV